MPFKSLQIGNWRQFRSLEIDFHERLTVITGANGSGKTTVLNLLSRHFGWQGNLVSTPRRRQSSTMYHADYWTDEYLRMYEKWLEENLDSGDQEPAVDVDGYEVPFETQRTFTEPPEPPAPTGPEQDIGSLTYTDGSAARLSVPPKVGVSFQVSIHGQQQQKGIHIPSHRPVYSHQSVENIPTVPRRRDQAFNTYMDIVRTRYYGAHHQRTPNYYMKETLIALAAFGYGNQIIERDVESLEIFEGFQDVLRIVLPPSLGFLRLSVRLPEVVLITKSGDFSLDAVSGGISSLIDMAWQVFVYATSVTPFVVTIDEPENHLHPELQRTVLGTFLSAFPKIQFICATHNPFIVTSVVESNTYALRYGDDHRVSSQILTSVDRSGSSNEVLRDVLGMPSSSPKWVETSLRDIDMALASQELTPQLVSDLRDRLTAVGLERFIPASLARLARERLANDQGESN